MGPPSAAATARSATTAGSGRASPTTKGVEALLGHGRDERPPAQTPNPRRRSRRGGRARTRPRRRPRRRVRRRTGPACWMSGRWNGSWSSAGPPARRRPRPAAAATHAGLPAHGDQGRDGQGEVGPRAARLRVLNTLAPTALCRAVPIGVASASRTIRPRWPPWAANHAPEPGPHRGQPAIPTPMLAPAATARPTRAGHPATPRAREPIGEPRVGVGNPMLQWPRVSRTIRVEWRQHTEDVGGR